jgi:hypothetical protein
LGNWRSTGYFWRLEKEMDRINKKKNIRRKA